MRARMSSNLTAESLTSGHILREPPGCENGYWVGAPGVFYAKDELAWYLTYRLRRPRGISPDRGGEARIARSTDLKTCECVSATGLATSRDLDNWDWQGVIFAPETSGWDRYCRRINSILPYQRKYFGFYDGSASHAENYEEKTGLAVSLDLRHWESLSAAGPLFTSPHDSGSLRYLDAQLIDGQACLFYEFARPDGAHDLRLAIAKADSLP